MRSEDPFAGSRLRSTELALRPSPPDQNAQELGNLGGREVSKLTQHSDAVLQGAVQNIISEQNMQEIRTQRNHVVAKVNAYAESSAEEIQELVKTTRIDVSDISRSVANLAKQVLKGEISAQASIASVDFARESVSMMLTSANDTIVMIERGFKATSNNMLGSVKTMIECDREHLSLIRETMDLCHKQENHNFDIRLKALKASLEQRKALFEEWKESEELNEKKQQGAHERAMDKSRFEEEKLNNEHNRSLEDRKQDFHEHIENKKTDLEYKFKEFAEKQKADTDRYCADRQMEGEMVSATANAASSASKCSVM